jgi:probable HAF family extracellular repeat protein
MKMRPSYRYVLVLVAIVMLGGATAAHPTTYEKIYVNVPGAAVTQTLGINNAGDVVGNYQDSGGSWHGFLFSGGVYTTLNVPGATRTEAWGINDAGQIVGIFNSNAGYMYSNGTYTLMDQLPPASGINNAGQIVCNGDNGGQLYSAGTFTSITISGIQYALPHDINNVGQLVGFTWTSGAQHGFYGTPGNFTVFDVPGHVGQTNAWGMNDLGQIVGYNWGNGQNFLLIDGVFTTLDINGEIWAISWGINNAGQITTGENFIANPVPLPSTLLFLGSGLLGLAGARLRSRKG